MAGFHFPFPAALGIVAFLQMTGIYNTSLSWYRVAKLVPLRGGAGTAPCMKLA